MKMKKYRLKGVCKQVEIRYGDSIKLKRRKGRREVKE